MLPRLTLFIAAALCLSSVAMPAALAQGRQVPASPGQLELSFAPIVKRVAAAVVNVYAARVVTNNNPCLADPFFRQFFGAVPREQVERSLGSGVIVDPGGLVVTNFHVIEGASQVKVALADNSEFRPVSCSRNSAAISPCCESRTPRKSFRLWNSPILTNCRSATWCWRSAIPLVSARQRRMASS